MSETAPVKAPAGWYPSSTHAGSQQYWDGVKWTENFAPLAPAAPQIIIQQRRSSLSTLLRILVGIPLFVIMVVVIFVAIASASHP